VPLDALLMAFLESRCNGLPCERRLEAAQRQRWHYSGACIVDVCFSRL
jgi:hypothetical protein